MDERAFGALITAVAGSVSVVPRIIRELRREDLPETRKAELTQALIDLEERLEKMCKKLDACADELGS